MGPLPAVERVACYRVYEVNGGGTYWHQAVVTGTARGRL